MKKREYELHTKPEGLYSITDKVRAAVRESGVQEGFCIIFCPHTTAGITINENADPDVVRDLLFALDRISPDRPEFRHIEGNSAAHLKTSLIGNSIVLPIESGKPVLGIWQGIYFCEFDGPRSRRFYVKVFSEK